MLHIPNVRQSWDLFHRLVRELVRSERGTAAKWIFAALIFLLISFNGLNVLNSYVGRDFVTTVVERNRSAYVEMALVYLGVFAVSTLVAVFQRWAEERLGLLWREFMTRAFLQRYLHYPTYYRMNDEVIRESGVEHPDQRIADDVRAFTTSTLSFVLLALNGSFTIVAFSGVLASISPWLFAVAFVYALFGTVVTVLLGRPLIDLNYAQLDKEASFRSGLMHVVDHAESVAMLHRESQILPRLVAQFEDLAANFRKIIVINRNMGFFTTGYNYLIQIIPVLVVAPLYMQGQVDFGVITQSAMAFATLVAAFSLIVTQFQSLSSYAAVVERLINLWFVIELAQTETVSALDMREEDDCVVFENLTLRSLTDGHVLVQELNANLPRGERVLVTSADPLARDALFKATAGLWDAGTGVVRRPPLDSILFLPERPYLPPGTLRQALVTQADVAVSDADIQVILEKVGAGHLIQRLNGLDGQNEWDRVLSLDEQRGVSLARVLLAPPHFAVLHDPFKDCPAHVAHDRLALLHEHGITVVTFGREGDVAAEAYDRVLDIARDGSWRWRDLAR